MSENTENNETTEENVSSDFNLENDFKVDPLIPNGTYTANVIQVDLKLAKANIQWKIALDGNGGFMNDGETPVDGATVFFNNWLPKKGDETTASSNGRGTKFQAKVNQMKKFADKMGITESFNTLTNIQEAIDNGDYIGLAVKVKVSTKEYPIGSGNFSNEVNEMIGA
jgi:hypothetical protein